MGKVSPVIMHAHCNNNNNSVVILSYRGFYKQAVHQLRFIEEVYFHPLGVEKGTLAQCIHHLGCLPTAPSGRVGALLSLIHISEPTRLLSISYAVFCLKKKKKKKSVTPLFYDTNQIYYITLSDQ
eukprot:TRINITY_DN7525_c0_g1_i18.p1 TRINITY_DN7525_c0_g1~~TRINITY_DN7525_c0_g1_i18.p1  ORF type:complete len:125 (+),score=23.01 TRINITY_DN7525_c0_g1_i18:198-572(+)